MNDNSELVKFCINKIGTPYVMGTNGCKLTQAILNDLIKRNPDKWFTTSRI